MNTKPRAKFDPGQQRYIILCGCGNYCKDTEILCGRCRHYHDNRIGLSLQKDPLPGASFVEFISIETEQGRIKRLDSEAVKDHWRKDQTRKSETDRIQEKIDRHVEHALKDKRSILDLILHERNFDFGGTVTGRMYRQKPSDRERHIRDRIAGLEAKLHRAHTEIMGLQSVVVDMERTQKSLRAQLEEASSVRLTASFQVGHEVKFTNMSSLGWVNVYRRDDGSLHISSCPKSTKWRATTSRSSNAVTPHLGTFQIFAKDFEP